MSTTRGSLQGPRAFDAETFASWLRRSREARGWNQTEFSERAGITRGTIRVFEKGEHKGGLPTVEIFERLAAGLELDLGFVLHKAGYNVGTDGVNMERLQRLEDTMRILDEAEPALRETLAEALHRIDSTPPAGAVEEERILRLGDKLGRALGVLDLVTTRLRAGRST